ncbi:MAG: hypothetical protein WKF37_05745 [Bryobacteraceae bacterium]
MAGAWRGNHHPGPCRGPLLVAMLLGKLERFGNISWVLPLSANLSLRHFGVILFLAGVGTRAGQDFFHTLRTDGPLYLALGAIVTIAVSAATLLLGKLYLKLPTPMLMGLMAGVQTQPACLAYANEQSNSDEPDLGYASVFPAAMIAKIVAAQALVLLLP